MQKIKLFQMGRSEAALKAWRTRRKKAAELALKRSAAAFKAHATRKRMKAKRK